MPEDMKELYRYKDGSEWFYLFFPNDKCDREFKYRLLSLAEIEEVKEYFQDKDTFITEFYSYGDDDGICGQIICYIHDPDEIAYVGKTVTEIIDDTLLNINFDEE